MNLKRLFSSSSPVAFDSAVKNIPSLSAKEMLSIASDAHELSHALEEIVVSAQKHDIHPHSAIVFFSSAYETIANFTQQDILVGLRKSFPTLKVVIAGTSGCCIGQKDCQSIPVEIESKPGMSVLFLNDATQSITSVTTMQATEKEILQTLKDHSSILSEDHVAEDDIQGVAFMLCTENIKSKLSRYLRVLRQREKVNIFGTAASSISMLQGPKIYITDASGENLVPVVNGMVAIVLKGDIRVTPYVAKSIVGVGPVFQITGRTNNTIDLIQV